MATVEDVEPDLRACARRIPVPVLELLSPLDLELRCSEAASLLAEADGAGPGRKAERLRKQAGLLLKAMTPSGLHLALETLGEELREARLSGQDRKAFMLQEEILALERQNPMPSPDRVLARVKSEVSKLKIPPAEQSRLFSRRRGR